MLLSSLLNAERVFRVMWVSSHISRAIVRVHVHEGVVEVTPPDTTIDCVSSIWAKEEFLPSSFVPYRTKGG